MCSEQSAATSLVRSVAVLGSAALLLAACGGATSRLGPARVDAEVVVGSGVSLAAMMPRIVACTDSNFKVVSQHKAHGSSRASVDLALVPAASHTDLIRALACLRRLRGAVRVVVPA